MPSDDVARLLHEQQLQHREDVIHSAAIRAALCAARGPSLLPAGVRASFSQAPALGVFLPVSDDTEGGSHD